MDLAKSDKWEFLEGWMLHGKKDITLTVKDVVNGDVYNPKTNEHKDEYQVIFEETNKKLILNKTNLKMCVKLFNSSESNDWKGRRIAVYGEWIKVGRDTVMGVRIRDEEPPPRQPTRRETKAANGKKAPAHTPPPPEETRDPVEIDLLAEVNAQCNNKYQHINHLLNGAKKANPDIDPDNLADPDNVQLIKTAAIEYANVPDVLTQPDTTGEAGQPSLLADAPAPYPD